MNKSNLPPGVSVLDPHVNPEEPTIDSELVYIFDHMYQSFASDIQGDIDENTTSRSMLFSMCCDYFEVTIANERDIISDDAIEYWEALNHTEKHEYETIVFEYEEYETGNF